MRIWSVLKKLSLKELFLLTSLMLRRPLLILPTLRATKETILICDHVYGNKHNTNGKENAFRHALWNLLICRRTLLSTKNEDSSINWAKRITDLHEKLAPNPELEKLMDLHNNEIGRRYFKKLKNSNKTNMISFLKEKTKEAKMISHVEDIISHQNNLIYLSEKEQNNKS